MDNELKYGPGIVPPEIALEAVKMEKKFDIPASLTIAQWALESGWGKCGIGNNVFGITLQPRHNKSQFVLTHENITWNEFQNFKPEERVTATEANGSQLIKNWLGKKYLSMKREFADFNTLDDAFIDHSNLLTGGPYLEAYVSYIQQRNITNFIKAISVHYGTGEGYANIVISIAQSQTVQNAIKKASS